MEYTRAAIKGISWSAALRGTTRIFSYIRIAIVARILSPEQLGLVAIGTLVLAFIEILTETGINIILIQQDEDIKPYIDTAWIVSILRGILISLVILIFSPLIVSFFNSPDAFPLLLTICVVPLLRGFINPSIVRWQKDLQFNKEYYFRSFIFFIDAVSAIVLTYILNSPIGIILGMLIGAAVEVVLSFYLSKLRPKIRIDRLILHKIFHRGKWVTASGVFNYLFQNGDDIVVGRLLNTTALGLYDAAYKISILPLTEIGDVIIKAIFPVYVKIADDQHRLRRAFLKHIALVIVLSVPVGIFFALFPRFVIDVILGPKWVSAAGVIQILVLFGVIRSITNSAFPLFLAVKRQEYTTYISIISFLVLAVCVVPLTNEYGLIGTAYAVNIASLIAIIPTIYYLHKVLYGHEKESK